MNIETATQNKGTIIAFDKNLKRVSPGNKVMYNGKVETIQELIEEDDNVRIGLDAWFGPYVVDEHEIELVLS